LPAAAEIPQLLKQMEQAAIQNGLEWRSAEYRIVAATALMPGSLEVHCGITGSYPKLRGMVVQLIRSVPALSIREFSASRSTAESIDVDAKLVLAVFLRDESAIPTSPNEVAR
jgi:Tfp pilus assembly protein PilO